MNARPLILVLVIVVAACANSRMTREAQEKLQLLRDDPDRYIVAGVDNPDATPAGRAGSSPKGYDNLTAYGPTLHASQLLQGLEHDYGLREVTAWPIAPLHMHCAVLEVTGGNDRATVIAALSHDKRIRIAQPLQSFATETTPSYDDPYVGLQRGFQQLDVPDAHEWSRGDGVQVAIIDTGADVAHPDLRGVVVRTRNFVDSDEGQFLRDRHGTELAGIIAAVANNREGIVGIAPGARLSVFKACWQLSPDVDAARCNSFTLAQALTAALDARVQIVNLSLSGPADPLLSELVQEGLRRGILFVGAAAPGPPDHSHFPDLEGVLRVENGGRQGDLGTPLHAPGHEILTLLPGGRYDFASGTSLATAHVTGAVALLLEKNPGMPTTAAYKLLRQSTARAVDGSADESINACEALISMLGHGACRIPETDRVAMH